MITIASAAAPFGRDLDAGFTRIEELLAAARERGAQMLVLPEGTLGGYQREADAGLDLPPALHPDGPEIARLARIAGDVVLVAGYTEAGADGELYASAVCVHDGKVLGNQRKVHLPPSERFAYTPGDRFAAFDTPVGRIGMLVCYDKLFPEAARGLVVDGAGIICCIAAWSADRHQPARRISADRQTHHWDILDQARAIENQVVWVSANQTGPWGPLRFLGGAKIVAPDGSVRARVRSRPGVAVASVDVADEIDTLRGVIDHLGDRMPHAYGPPDAAAGTALGRHC